MDRFLASCSINDRPTARISSTTVPSSSSVAVLVITAAIESSNLGSNSTTDRDNVMHFAHGNFFHGFHILTSFLRSPLDTISSHDDVVDDDGTDPSASCWSIVVMAVALGVSVSVSVKVTVISSGSDPYNTNMECFGTFLQMNFLIPFVRSVTFAYTTQFLVRLYFVASPKLYTDIFILFIDFSL